MRNPETAASQPLATQLVADHYAIRGSDLIAGGLTIDALAREFDARRKWKDENWI